MKSVKRTLMIGAVVAMFGALTVNAYAAASNSTPAELAASLTGRTVEAVTAERYETGKTYGTIANEAGKLEEFQSEMIQVKKAVLEEKVADGIMTQERADSILNAIEENQAACDGTGNLTGNRMGAGFGSMNGNGEGNGQGNRRGAGGNGQGNGICQAE